MTLGLEWKVRNGYNAMESVELPYMEVSAVTRQIPSTITAKGQITLPAEVRRHLGVSVRDKVVFVIDDDGDVRVRPAKYSTVASLAGAAGSLKSPMSWEDMREIAREDRVAAKFER